MTSKPWRAQDGQETTRTPRLRRGDFRAQIAANRLAHDRLADLMARWGDATVFAAFDEVLAYTERRTREVVQALPDGEYMASSQIEGDGVTDEDRRGRELFRAWCEAAGLSVSVDRMGSMFCRRAGRDESRPPVLLGSHLDSQPTGGKFDGALGVLAALEVIRTLNDHGIATAAPLEVVNWTNEEGCRFAPAMVASGVFAGVFDLDWLLEPRFTRLLDTMAASPGAFRIVRVFGVLNAGEREAVFPTSSGSTWPGPDAARRG